MSTRTLIRGHDLAVPVSAIARSVAQLLAHGGVPRGYLGVGVTSVALSKQLSDATGKRHGALISGLDDGGPAERAGLRQGDIIITLAGAPIAGPAELRQAVSDHPGADLTVEVLRGGAVTSFLVTLGNRP